MSYFILVCLCWVGPGGGGALEYRNAGGVSYFYLGGQCCVGGEVVGQGLHNSGMLRACHILI